MRSISEAVPEDVLAAYGFSGAGVVRIDSLINRTFDVELGGRRAIVQRLHPIFGPEVNLDIEAVTERLAERGVTTPRLVRTLAGEACVEREDGVWRALTHIEGVTHERVRAPELARAAGSAVAAFHAALGDFDYEFRFRRAGVHDTRAHLAALRSVSGASRSAARAAARALAREILEQAAELDLALASRLPLRLCHGDLKISNLLFAAEGPARVVCLIDLDTLGRQTMAYELGDALRSWCNPNAEDVERPSFDVELFDAALEGYAEGGRGLLSVEEVDAIAPGTLTVCLELAARFCRDAFEDRYFGWDPQRYASRTDHNLARARSMVGLARDLRRRIGELGDRARARLAP